MAGHFASVRALGVVRSGDTFDQIYDATYVLGGSLKSGDPHIW